jgi:hypothetical protein
MKRGEKRNGKGRGRRTVDEGGRGKGEGREVKEVGMFLGEEERNKAKRKRDVENERIG